MAVLVQVGADYRSEVGPVSIDAPVAIFDVESPRMEGLGWVE